MSFNISEKDLPTNLSIPQFIDTFEKIDSYIIEKERLLKDLELKILSESSNLLMMNSELQDLDFLLSKLEREEETLTQEIKDSEEKELRKKEFYAKLLENTFDNSIRMVENPKPYPEDKYFTVEWTLPASGGKAQSVIYVMFDVESRKIVGLNDSKGKQLDKENIDWTIFQIADKRNRNSLLLEIYKEYSQV